MQHLLLIPFTSICLVAVLTWAVSLIIDHDMNCSNGVATTVAKPAPAEPLQQDVPAPVPSAQIIYLRKQQTSLRSSGRIAINGG